MDYDLEKFKEYTSATDEGSANRLLRFKSEKEKEDFVDFILENEIPRSGYGFTEREFENVGVFWCTGVNEVWGARLFQADKTYSLEDFQILSFNSTEEDVLNFIRI